MVKLGTVGGIADYKKSMEGQLVTFKIRSSIQIPPLGVVVNRI